MQNKANLLDTQMNVSSVTTKEYENERLFRRPENKPKQTHIFRLFYLIFLSFLLCFRQNKCGRQVNITVGNLELLAY
jgi:hypothetical protein